MKYQLSEEEQKAIENMAFFKAKRNATDKILQELNALRSQIKTSSTFQHFDFPKEMDTEVGKISKGENYNGLPYLILDFPRFFSVEGIFAYRAMFWWGHGFYFTLHLSGKYLAQYQNAILQHHTTLLNNDFWINRTTDEWIHQVVPPFYQPIEETFPLEHHLAQSSVLKLARKLNIKELGRLRTYGLESFELFFGLLS